MLKGFKYIAFALVATALFAMVKNDLVNVRGLSTDTTFYTTQLAELTRLEKELLQFRVQASGVVHAAPTASRDKMLLAFDLIWARVNTEYKRFVNPRIDALKRYEETLGALSRDLKDIDPIVQALQQGDHAALARIETTLNKTSLGISAMTDDSYTELYSRATDTTVMMRKALGGVNHLLHLFLITIFLGAILLLWQLRKSERLNRNLAASEAEIRRLATVDPLTELRNRRYFDERMQAIDEGVWTGNLHVLLVDLDGFKAVNDTMGHAAGDYLLKTVARRLVTTAGHNTLLARLGGDEFALVCDGANHDALGLAQRIIAELSLPIAFGSGTLLVGASVGVSSFSKLAPPSTVMLREADLALYEAKARGRGCAVHFNELKRPRPVRTVPAAAGIHLAAQSA